MAGNHMSSQEKQNRTSPKHIGGQAIVEGVMIRSPNAVAMVVRRTNGKLVVRTENLENKGENSIWKKPFFRGMRTLWQSLVLGIKAINFSAGIYDEEQQDENKKKAKKQKNKKQRTGLSTFEITLSIIIALAMVIVLYKAIPLAAAGLLKSKLSFFGNTIVFNSVDALVKTSILIFVMWSMSFMKDIRRLYEYHGAEHMAIFTYEEGKDLSAENALVFDTLHPRCGTNFLIMVFLISLFFFLAINPELPYVWKLLPRLALLPVIAGVTYEIIRFGSKKMENSIFKALMKPGLALQRITTRKPDKQQVEVALAAVKAVLERESNFRDGIEIREIIPSEGINV